MWTPGASCAACCAPPRACPPTGAPPGRPRPAPAAASPACTGWRAQPGLHQCYVMHGPSDAGQARLCSRSALWRRSGTSAGPSLRCAQTGPKELG